MPQAEVSGVLALIVAPAFTSGLSQLRRVILDTVSRSHLATKLLVYRNAR